MTIIDKANRYAKKQTFVLDAATKKPLRCGDTNEILNFYNVLEADEHVNNRDDIKSPIIYRKFRWIPEQFKQEFILQVMKNKK